MGDCVSRPGIDASLKTQNLAITSRAVRNRGENTSSKNTVEYSDSFVSKTTSTSSEEAVTSLRKKNVISDVYANMGQSTLLSDSFGKANLFTCDIFCNLNSGSESKDECEWSTDSSSELSSMEEIFSFDGLNKRTTNRYVVGLEILKAQIHHGANPKNLVTHGDRTCLMFSVLAEDFDFVKNLVELGVDVNETNSQLESALGFAINLKRDDIASYLRRKGALEVAELVRGECI